jgi:phosphonate transport system substrate-binding protein
MIAGRDFKAVYSGKHDNSILGVANKDYVAASIANSVKSRMIKRGVIKAEDVITIYKSQTFPTTGFGYAHNLNPALKAKIQETFFSFQWDKPDWAQKKMVPTSLKEEFSKSKEGQFIPISYKTHWAVIRTIDEANGVSYACK